MFIGRRSCLFKPISVLTERDEFPDLSTLVAVNTANILNGEIRHVNEAKMFVFQPVHVEN